MFKHLRTFIALSTIVLGILAGASVGFADEIGSATQVGADTAPTLDPNG